MPPGCAVLGDSYVMKDSAVLDILIGLFLKGNYRQPQGARKKLLHLDVASASTRLESWTKELRSRHHILFGRVFDFIPAEVIERDVAPLVVALLASQRHVTATSAAGVAESEQCRREYHNQSENEQRLQEGPVSYGRELVSGVY